MLRNVLAVIFGYLAMVACVMLTFSLAFIAPDFAFQKDSFEVNSSWIIYAMVVSLLAAVLGGWVTALVARPPRFRSVLILAGLIIVLGLASAIGNSMQEPPPAEKMAREEIAKMTTLERASRGVQPTWYAFTLPFVGAVGVLAGGFGFTRRFLK